MLGRRKQEADGTLVKKGQFREMWERLKKNKRAMICLVVLVLMVLICIFVGLVYDYQTYVVDQHMKERNIAPSWEHLLGTDQYGRDIFVRVLFGVRVALLIGFGTTTCSLFIAILLGCTAAFFGGMVDNLIMRVMDILQTIPALVLAMAICAGLGNGMIQLMVAICMGQIAPFTRLIRAKGLSVANMEFIEAGKAMGASNLWMIFRYMLPNIASVVIVQGTLTASQAILTGATLSFIGLGVKAPTPEWGAMLNTAIAQIQLYPYMLIGPGVALVISSLSINTLGDCIRDAFDPQLKGKA